MFMSLSDNLLTHIPLDFVNHIQKIIINILLNKISLQWNEAHDISLQCSLPSDILEYYRHNDAGHEERCV